MVIPGQPVSLLSIVIPTRNRMAYAPSAIKSILSIPDPDLELVIQDSSDTRALERYLIEKINDPRLRYHYSTPPMSGVENFNAAAELATGEYVTFIGDDDGVNPEIMAAVRWMKSEQLDALSPTTCAHYSWPDLVSRHFGKRHASCLYVWRFTGKRYFPDVETEMRRCVRGAGQEIGYLPKVYTGIVRKACIDQVKERTGVYFGGASPDIFGALAVANFIQRYCIVDYPLLLAGGSGKSTAGDSAKGKHIGRLEDIPHLKPEVVRNWPGVIPRFYSVETVRAQAALAALEAMGRYDLICQFNVPLLHALCALAHHDYLPLILRNYSDVTHKQGQDCMRATGGFAVALSEAFGRRARFVARRLAHPSPSNGADSVDNLPNVADAVLALSDYLSKSKKTFRG
jgi:hypothetical protein